MSHPAGAPDIPAVRSTDPVGGAVAQAGALEPDHAEFFGDDRPVVALPARILVVAFAMYSPYLWLLLPGPGGWNERHVRWLKTWVILPGFVFRNGERLSSPDARMAMGMATFAFFCLLLIPRRRAAFSALMVVAFAVSAVNAYFCFLIYWR